MDELRHFSAQALAHFFKFMNATPKFPFVLFLGNHISHLSIEAVAKTRKKGVHIYTFPPKRSYQMQLLDIAVYGPFKRYYASFCNACLTSHPRSTISSYEIAGNLWKGLRERSYSEKHYRWI